MNITGILLFIILCAFVYDQWDYVEDVWYMMTQAQRRGWFLFLTLLFSGVIYHLFKPIFFALFF